MLDELRIDDAGMRLIGLARRAGLLIPGMDRIRPLAEAGASVLILADAALSERSRRELSRWMSPPLACRGGVLGEFAERVSVLDLKGLKALGLADEGFQSGVLRHLTIIKTGEQGGSIQEA